MRLHHIGYIVEDIAQTSTTMQTIGYKYISPPHLNNSGHTIEDDIQRCRICFLVKEGEPQIELVEPWKNNKSLRKMLVQRGNAPYHLCYEVDDVEKLFEQLSTTEGWTPLFRPVEAVAFSGKLIMYFYNDKLGYVEFVNK